MLASPGTWRRSRYGPSASRMRFFLPANLTYSLGAHLRVGFGRGAGIRRVSGLPRIPSGSLPETTYLASFHLAPVGAVAILHLDHAVAFPVIDLLLGGEGRGQETRPAIPPTSRTTFWRA